MHGVTDVCIINCTVTMRNIITGTLTLFLFARHITRKVTMRPVFFLLACGEKSLTVLPNKRARSVIMAATGEIADKYTSWFARVILTETIFTYT